MVCSPSKPSKDVSAHAEVGIDPEKGKYFKIEKSHTAPGGAAWSSDAVKRRKTEEVAEQAVQRRRRELRRHIARHALREDVLLGGMLRREVDGMGPFGAGDVRAAGWAGGVVRKGAVRFGQGQGANLPCLWVGGTEEMGVAYTSELLQTTLTEVMLMFLAALDEESLLGSYIQADADGRIRLDGGTHAEPVRCPQMSSIQYHGPSHKVLLTSREPDHTCGLYLFSPPLEGGEHWLLGEGTFFIPVGWA